MKTNPLRRFVVVAAFSIGLVVYWFMTMSQTDFPTSEVQYAIMPALLHPYLHAWQAPYSIVWYGIQWGIIYTILPFVTAWASLTNPACPNHCLAIIQYINGTQSTVPFDGGPFQYLMSLSWMIGLAVFNLPFIWILRKSQLLVAYFMTSMWLWATTPVNLPILWIIIAAFLPLTVKNRQWGWLMIPFATLVKLPVGAPGYVWKFAVGSGSTVGHWFPYILLGFWTLGVGVYWIDKALHNGSYHWFPWLDPNWRVISQYE